MPRHHVAVLGASYGSLLATKLLIAGHDVTLVCLPEEAELINDQGTRVRMPVADREDLLEIDSRTLPGTLSADTPDAVDPSGFALVSLAMQEPQYRANEVRGLIERVAEAGRPCMSIMNMPPLPYLARIEGIPIKRCRDAYTDATVWDPLDPGLVTMCSPDPQAFRPPDGPVNVLQVRLPTNFKAARFDDDEHTQVLRDLEADVEASRLKTDDGELELPVKLRVHDSLFVPMAKWAMLLAGNYRCIQRDGLRPIQEAVHSDVDASREIYDWVRDVCKKIGASDDDLVPFQKYADAADGLRNPSSVSRALVEAGAPAVERVDRLVQTIGAEHGMQNDAVDEIVALVDAKLEENARVAA